MTKPIVFWLQIFGLVAGMGLMGMAIQVDTETPPVYAPKRGPASVTAPLVNYIGRQSPDASQAKLQFTNPVKEKSLLEDKTRGIVRPFGSTGNQNLPEEAPGTKNISIGR